MNEKEPQPTDEPIPETLWRNTKVNGVTWLGGVGPKPADIMFISPVVSEEEAAEKKRVGYDTYIDRKPRFTDCGQWQIIKQVALEHGVDVDECYVTSIVKYLPENKSHRSRPPKTMLMEGMTILENEIRRVKPKIIVCLGKVAFDQLHNEKLKESDIYGAWFDSRKYKCRIYPMMHISQALKPEKMERWHLDFQTVRRELLAMNGVTVDEIPLNYLVIRNSKELEALVSMWEAREDKVFSIDGEWNGCQHIDGKLRTFQFCWAPGQAACVRFMDDQMNYVFDVSYKEAGKILGRWLNRPDVKYIGHHVSVDLTWMHYWLGLDWYHKAIFDSEFATQICDESLDLGLDAVALRYTPFGKYDLDLIRWKKANPHKADDGYGLIPDDILIPYSCLRGDAQVALEDGSYLSIEKIYAKKLTPRVKCLDADGNPTTRKVRRVYRNPRDKSVPWYKVITTSSKENGKRPGAVNGPLFTPDHNILTERGFVPVLSLIPGVDKVITEDEALSHQQKEIIFGGLLGDMGIAQRNRGQAGLIFSQAERRAGYAEWKAACLQSLAPVGKHTTGKLARLSYRTKYSPVINEIIDSWPRYDASLHKHKRLIVSDALLDEWLTDLALAIWFQDDGVLARGSHDNSRSVRIAFKSVNGDHELLLARLRKRFGKVTYLPGNRIFSFSVAATNKFAEAVRPYIHPDCMYKLPEEFRNNNTPAVIKGSGKRHADLVTKVVAWPDRKSCPGHGDPDKYSYCLEVEECGNFLTKLGYVANCKDVDTVMRAWPHLTKWMKKQGLTKYYDEICNPFVTDVFTYWCLKGIPVDRAKLNEMRDLYNWAKGELEIDFRSAMVKDARKVFAERLEEYGVTEPADAVIDKFDELQRSGKEAQCMDGIKELVGVGNWADMKNVVEHYIQAPDFNIRSKPQMQRWLFDVKRYIPVKSTANKAEGMPSVDWNKVLAYPPEKQKLYTPASDKGTLEILARRYDDKVIDQLLELNAVGNLCKAFLKPADVDDDGEVVRENGIAYWQASDDRIHLNHSTTQQGSFTG